MAHFSLCQCKMRCGLSLAHANPERSSEVFGGAGKSQLMSFSWLETGCGVAEVCWPPLKQCPGLCQCFLLVDGQRGSLLSEQAKMPFEQVKLLSCEKSFCESRSLGVPPWDISAGSQELALWLCCARGWQPGCPQVLHCWGHQGCLCRPCKDLGCVMSWTRWLL